MTVLQRPPAKVARKAIGVGARLPDRYPDTRGAEHHRIEYDLQYMRQQVPDFTRTLGISAHSERLFSGASPFPGRFPELNLVALRIGDPGEAAIFAVVALGIDGDALGAQSFQ
jgi:hypothetical protein